MACTGGVALATDSRLTVKTGGAEPRFEIASDEAEKLFLHENRIAVATHGEAEVGGELVADLMKQFRGAAANGAWAYANALGEWFSQKMSAAAEPRRGDLVTAESLHWPLGFVVAGFDQDVGHVHAVRVRAGDFRVAEQQPSTEDPGVHTFGQNDGIDRLLTGVDVPALREAKLSFDEKSEEKLGLLSYDLIIPESVEAAAKIAESLIGVQLLAQEISWRAYASKDLRIPGCGGSVRTIAVTAAGAEWLSRGEAASRRRSDGLPAQVAVAPHHARRSA